MKAKRILASFIAMAMTMGMMSSLVLADESESAPEETSVVETTEPKEKETKKPEEKKPSETKAEEPTETKAAVPEEKEPEDTTESEPSQIGEAEPAESKKEEPSEPDETEPETTAVPDSGRKEDKHAVPPKNDQVPATEITSVQITLDAPVIGARPDYTAEFPFDVNYYSEAFSNEYYQNFICWLDVTNNSHMYKDSAVFKAEHEYQVILFLTAKDGFSFTTGTSAKVNGEYAKISIDEEGHLRVAYNFSKLPKEITSVSITLDAPVAGAKPDYTAIHPTGANYYSAGYNEGYFNNGVIWGDGTYNERMDPDNGVFNTGHQYSVTVFLKPKDGYGFSRDVTAKLNGQSATVSLNSRGYLTVYYEFAKLEGETELISSVSVTVDAPVIGASPDYTAVFPSDASYYSYNENTGSYRNGIFWVDATTKTAVNPDNGLFKAGHQYRVSVYLKAQDGYDFSSNATAILNGQSAATEILNGKLCVEYTFPALEGEADDIIPYVSVNLDAPVVGAKPDFTVVFPADALYYSDDYNQGNYYNGICWWDASADSYLDPDNDVFKVGHKYIVYIYLRAKSGYNFSRNVPIMLNAETPDNISTYSDGRLQIIYTFSVLNSSNIGDTATVDGNNYKITNNNTDGTGTVTLTGVSVKRASVSIPATVVINGYVYKVNRIGAKAFYGNKTITSLTVGSNVVIIDSYAFYGCSNLVKVSGGKVLKSIGSKAFAYCSKLKSFSISSTVLNKISSYSFQKDKKLKTIYIKNTTKLTKSGVKKSLKGSKVKTVKVKKSKVKKYKKYFKKSNSGRSVKVKK